jgi:hypothetical protein
MANIRIAVINASTVLTDDQVRAAVPLLQTQMHRDFAAVWGIDADLSFMPPGFSWASTAAACGVGLGGTSGFAAGLRSLEVSI